MIGLYGAVICGEQNSRLSAIKGTPIYSHDFSELGDWTIINGPGVAGVPNSAVTWIVPAPNKSPSTLFPTNEGSSPATYKAAYISYGTMSGLHDDWLISPSIAFEAGKKYALNFDVLSDGAGTERIEVYIGNGNTIADQTTPLADYGIISNGNLNPGGVIYNRDLTFSVPTSGNYNIAFRNTSFGANAIDFCMSNVKINEVETVLSTPYFHDFKTFSGWVTTNVKPNYPTAYPGGTNSVQGFDIPSQSSASLKNPFDLFAGTENTISARHAAAQLNRTVASGKPHNDWLISPAIRLEEGKTYTIDFEVALQSNGTELLKLYVGNGYAVANMTTELDSYTIVASATGDVAGTKFSKRVEFTPTETRDYNFGFYDYSAVNTCGSLLISNFDLKEMPTVNAQKDLAVVSLSGENSILANEASVYTVNIINLGDETQNNYTVQLVDAEDNVVAETVVTDEAIAFNQNKNVTITWTPAAEMEKTVFANVILEGDEDLTNNKTTESLTITVKGHYAVNGTVTNRVFTTLEGCVVKLKGFREYTTTTLSNGTFSFPAIYTADNYTLTITKDGYNEYTSTFNVEKQNVDLGGIILVKKGGYGSIYTYDFTELGDWTVIDDYPGETNLGSPCNWIAPSVGPYGNPFPTIAVNKYKNALYSANSKRAANDWLISPSFEFVVGETYKFFFDVAVDQWGNEKFKVTIGKGVTAEAQNRVLADYVGITNKTIERKEVVITVEETGSYNIGFHCYSDKDQGSLMISNIDLQGTIAVEMFKDLKAVSVSGPNTVEVDKENTFTVLIENIGIEPQSNYTVEFVVNNNVVGSEVVAEVIEPKATKTVSFKYTASSIGDINVFGRVVLALDEVTDNNTTDVVNVEVVSGMEAPGAPTNVIATRTGMVVTVKWDAPTAGINGGLFDVTSMTYKVTRIPDYIVVAEGLAQRSFTETLATAGVYSYRVQAINNVGVGGVTNSNEIKVGGSYSVPYFCNFDNLLNEWTVVDANTDGKTWRAPIQGNHAGQVFPWGTDLKSAECTYSLTNDANDWLITPAIEMQAGAKYRIKHETTNRYGQTTEDFKVTIGKNKTVSAQSTTLATHSITRAQSEDPKANIFTEYFTCEETGDYYIGFHCISKKDQGGLILDEIEITKSEGKDLAAISITGPSIIKNNAPSVYNVVVENKGSEIQNEYILQLIDGDQNVLATKNVTTPIVPDSKQTIEIDLTPTSIGDIVVFGKVVLNGDFDNANDRTSGYVQVKIRNAYTVTGKIVDIVNAPVEGVNVNVQGFYPYTTTTNSNGIFTLTDVFSANDYSIKTWKKGYQDCNSTFNVVSSDVTLNDFVMNEIIVEPYGLKIVDNGTEKERIFEYSNEPSIFDDFEGHNPFVDASSGRIGWTYIDGDNYALYAHEGFAYPGWKLGIKASWMTFNPFLTIPPIDNRPNMLAHSGNQYIMSMACVDPTNEDYIVSPLLNFGVDFKLKFWARSSTEVLERFQIGYSTTGNSMGDFENWVQLGLYEEVPSTQWTQFSYTIPAAAKYVTIKCVSDAADMMMVDDIFIGHEAPETKSFTTYEIYLDGTKVAETKDRSYKFTDLSLGDHTAGVVAVYNSARTTMKTIEFVTTNKYIVNITNCPGGTLSVKSGNTTITNGMGVNANTPLTITATPDGGYNLTSLTVNGVDFVSGGTYIVNTNVEIAVVFTQKVWNVTIQQPEVGGTIEVTANGNVVNSGSTIPNGTQIVINNNPDDGYKLRQIKINGIAITGNKYTVVKDVVVNAEFMIINGVENAQELSVKTYPNPVKDVLNIEGEYNSIEIYDISGKMVESINSMESQINIEKLPSATYILKINIGEKQIMRRIIKQ